MLTLSVVNLPCLVSQRPGTVVSPPLRVATLPMNRNLWPNVFLLSSCDVTCLCLLLRCPRSFSNVLASILVLPPSRMTVQTVAFMVVTFVIIRLIGFATVVYTVCVVAAVIVTVLEKLFAVIAVVVALVVIACRVVLRVFVSVVDVESKSRMPPRPLPKLLKRVRKFRSMVSVVRIPSSFVRMLLSLVFINVTVFRIVAKLLMMPPTIVLNAVNPLLGPNVPTAVRRLLK